MKEKNMLNLKLSDFVEQCLSKGVVSVLRFADKDKVEAGERISALEQTPATTLEREIRFFERMITRIENREGIDQNAGQERLDEIVSAIKGRVELYKQAITLLNSEQSVQECDATPAKSISEPLANNHGEEAGT
jgi:hypothetical protein